MTTTTTNPVPPMPAHGFLRQETRREHAAAEDTPVMRSLFDAGLGAPAYVGLLQGYRALYMAWEARHAAWLVGGLLTAGWHYRSRLAALEDDLREFGAGFPVRAPSGPGRSAAWGSLYVIEGSVLGGRVIARKLAATLPGHAHRFFNLGSDEASWKTFQAMLDREVTGPDAVGEAVRQARDTFGVFLGMLENVPVGDALPGFQRSVAWNDSKL